MTEAPNIPTSDVKLVLLKRVLKTVVFKPYLSCFIKEKSLQWDRKNWLSANSLELHQPNMHIDYRVIPLSVHIVSLARSIFNGIWPTLLQNIICCRILWRWVRTTFGFRVCTNMFSPVAYHEDGGSLKIYFRCFIIVKLALSYAKMYRTIYFTKSRSFV